MSSHIRLPLTFTLRSYSSLYKTTALPHSNSSIVSNTNALLTHNRKRSTPKMLTPTNEKVSASTDYDCAICTEDFSEERPPIPLDSCQHVFCQNCIKHWMHSNNVQRDKCPVCRTPIVSQQVEEDVDRARVRQARVRLQPAHQPAQVQQVHQ
jgi:hypothetical protein